MQTSTYQPYAVDAAKKVKQQMQTQTPTRTPTTPPAQSPQAPNQSPAVPQQQAQPMAQPQTFAQLQAAGQARPAPPVQAPAPQPMTQFASGAHPFGGGGGATARGLLQQLMDNPSSYNSEAMQREYANRGMAIDDEYTMAERDLEGEMARRGIFDSNIAGDRTRGLLLAKRDAKTSLAESLLQKLADTQAGDLRSAAALGLQTEASDRDFGLRNKSLGLQAQLERERMGLTREEMADRRGQFDRSFGEQQRQFDLGRGDRRFEYEGNTIRDWFDILGGYEGLGDVFGGGAGAPQTGGLTPGYNPDPYPGVGSGGGYGAGPGGGGYPGSGGGGLTDEELLQLLQY